MDPIVLLIGGFGVACALVVFVLPAGRTTDGPRDFPGAVAACTLDGLTWAPDGRSAQGSRDGLPVALEHVTESVPLMVGDAWSWSETSHVRVRIGGLARVSLHPRGRFDRPDFATGDERFDAAVRAAGHEDVLRAVLDGDARVELRFLVDGGHHVTEGTILARCDNYRGLPRLLESLLHAAGVLRTRSALSSRLAATVARERHVAVRLAGLRALAARHAADPAALAVLRAAASDPSRGVRAAAARGLAEEGWPVLRALLQDVACEDAACADAVAGLRRALTRAEAESVLGDALARNRVATAVSCVELLGSLGDPEAEPRLVALLGTPQATLRRAAADALARVGTVRAVADLHAAAETRALPRDVVGRAVAAIQSRRAGASAGQLTLAPVGAGEVSLPADASGRVSVARDEDA